MSRLATSFVLGYHGCDRDTADRCISGESSILHSDKDYDWLGPGAYFWESDPQRAMEWAEEGRRRGKIVQPDVLGAVIDLRHCLDLMAREDIELVQTAYEAYIKLQAKAGLEPASNKCLPGDDSGQRLLRYLDCAVLRHLHWVIEQSHEPGLEPFDTVRGMFTEGSAAFPGSGFAEKSHIQIAVRSQDCIRGFFRPLRDGKLQFASSR